MLMTVFKSRYEQLFTYFDKVLLCVVYSNLLIKVIIIQCVHSFISQTKASERRYFFYVLMIRTVSELRFKNGNVYKNIYLTTKET